MEKVREEEKVIYTPHWIKSKIGPGWINGYCIEHDEVDCYQTIAGIINRDFSVEKYASKLNRTRGNEIKNYGEDSFIGPVPVLPRGAYVLAYLASIQKEDEIVTLLQAGAVPDKNFTLLVHGKDSEIWEYLHNLYTEFKRRRMTKPACITHN